MSAIAARRRHATRLVAWASAAVVMVVVACGLIGANALYNSSDGTDAAGPDRPVRQFPSVGNFLVGVVDNEGRLASLAVFTERPGGPGGSIVPVPANAAARVDGQQVSLRARFEGDERSLEVAVGGLLGMSFDDVTILRQPTLSAVLAPAGEATVDLPAAVIDERVDPETGDPTAAVVYEPGEQRMGPDALAEVLTARSATVPDDIGTRAPVADENDVAVWEAVAASVAPSSGDATGPSTSSASASSVPASRGAFRAFASSFLAGPVEVRGLASHVIDGAAGDGEQPLVRVQRADVLLVFGQISPRHVAAPAASFNVRVVAPFDTGIVPGRGTAADIAARAIGDLVIAEVNVVSVSTSPGEVPATSRLEVINRDVREAASRIADEVVGSYDVVAAEYKIPGVDVVITLGEDYLTTYEPPDSTATPPTTAGD